MPPKKSADAPNNGDLSEFRKDLLAMQESFQATMHASFIEMGAMLADRLARVNPLFEDAETEGAGSDDTNPFARHRDRRRTVDEYADEFSLLLTRTDIYDSAEQLVSRFIGGLRPQLQTALAQFDPTTIAEAHRRAASFEQTQRSSPWTNQSSRSRTSEQTTTPTTTKEGDAQPQTTGQLPTPPADVVVPPVIPNAHPKTLICSYSTFVSELRSEGVAFALLPASSTHTLSTTTPPALLSALDDSSHFPSSTSRVRRIKLPMLLVAGMEC
ncbi:hypothetical protein YC2023_040944 [Brassica napus]